MFLQDAGLLIGFREGNQVGKIAEEHEPALHIGHRRHQFDQLGANLGPVGPFLHRTGSNPHGIGDIDIDIETAEVVVDLSPGLVRNRLENLTRRENRIKSVSDSEIVGIEEEAALAR